MTNEGETGKRLAMVREIGLGLVAVRKGVKQAVRDTLPAIEEILAAGGTYRQVAVALEKAGALPEGADPTTIKRYVHELRRERREVGRD